MGKELYSAEDIKVMEIAKNSLNKSRMQELINFCRDSNYKKIGIANCLSMQKYADNLQKILSNEGFEVFSINCKKNNLKNSDLFKNDSSGISCDPAEQAHFLNTCNTDINIVVGLCFGHDLIFQKYSKAPTSTLLVKDFSSNHNTEEVLR